ncbi:hypothetical protein DSM104299_02324 [Baekduia alba]|uniref:hypothetical protein n=1 Tax=Baekduia alba TaxID=2997333 RepID=UPI002340C847|nr:hypothetical protein [Baekduia alba]WCB93608.1 hypothetical protein DSM104299_02324 [Baekduia alba]
MTKTIILLAALLALALAAPAAHASDASSARSGAAWLSTNVKPGADGMAADALVALRAAGRLPSGQAARRARALRAGAARYANSAGATGKTILALVAARSGSARCAGRVDLLRRLNGYGRAGRYGSTIFDQTLGMLAARALHAGPSSRAATVLLGARGHGGWNFNLTRLGGRPDDVTSTAMAILAARAAGVSPANGTLRAGLRWMRAQRTAAGGFALGRRDRNEANSTALAIEATRAMGSRDTRASAALRSLQRAGGAFQFTRTDAGSRILATNDAVVALAGRRLPVTTLSRTPAGC